MGRISMPQGKGSQMHNRREYDKYDRPLPENIDSNRISENITLVDKDIRTAYKEIFGTALERYNSKQKRTDRKITDYYEHVQKSKNGEKLFYEDIVQWGTKDDFKSPEIRERAKEALIEYVKGFEERNPNLRLIGAYIHMDEASPHLHLDYVPVATGYSRGLDTRNSLDKAMKQMGFKPSSESRKNNATKLWKESERAVFGKICRNCGLKVEAERSSNRENLTVEEYKEIRDKIIGEAEREAEDIVANARVEVQGIKTSMVALNAEFKAKQAFIDECDKISNVSFMYPPEVKIIEKGVVHKQQYVMVPKDMWEAKHVSADEKSYLKKAEDKLNKGFEKLNSTNLAQENKVLRAELRSVTKERDEWKSKSQRSERALDGFWNTLKRVVAHFPEPAAASFWKLWEKFSKGKDQQRTNGLKL